MGGSREWSLGLDAVESEYLGPLLRLARNEFCKSLRGISEDDNTRCTVAGLSARSARKPRATSTAASLHGSLAPTDLSLLHVRFPTWSGPHLLMLSVTGYDPVRTF